MTHLLTLTHPQIALIAGIRGVYKRVLAGEWGVVAEVVEDRLTDPTLCSMLLNECAEQSGFTFTTPDDLPGVMLDIEAGELTFTGPEEDRLCRTVLTMLDLFQRIHMGQWTEVDYVCAMNSQPMRADGWDPDTLLRMRGRFAKHYDMNVSPVDQRTGFPDHPHSSLSIAGAALPARIAYHCWKALGAGTPGGPTFSLPDGEVTVQFRTEVDA